MGLTWTGLLTKVNGVTFLVRILSIGFENSARWWAIAFNAFIKTHDDILLRRC